MFAWTGQNLGNYQVLRVLGYGGFADVYLGQHLYLKTYAAIKVLHTRLGYDDLQTFLQEAQIIASLAHPHIVRVLEFGEEGYTPYLVMDYCSDGTLRQRHPKGVCVSLPECVDYIEQVAEALSHAHSLNIIHRDIKPENILIGQNGTLLLSDFGIAIVSQNSRSSHHQDIGGTIAYSAPEQLQGRSRPASDQYSLGIALYEWLSGELPYQGSFSEIASQHLVAPIPAIRDKVPSLSISVEQVLLKALAKDPSQRFQNVRDFAAALRQATKDEFSPTVLPTEPVENQTNHSTYIKTQRAPSIKFSSIPSYQPIQRPARRRIGLSVAIIVLLLLALAAVSVRAFLVPLAFDAQHKGASTSTLPSRQATFSPTVLPTPTPTPTPAPKVIQVNRQLPCLQIIATTDCTIALTVTSFLLNSAQNQMEMTLSINSQQDCADGFFSASAGSVSDGLNFQDPTGKTYQPGGQLQPYNNFSVAQGQTLRLTAIYLFIPSHGSIYTLVPTELNCSGDPYLHRYAATQFSF